MADQVPPSPRIRLPLPEELLAVTRQELSELEHAKSYAARDWTLAALALCVSSTLNAITGMGRQDWLGSVPFLLNAGVAVACGTLGAMKALAWIEAARTRHDLRARIEGRPLFRVELIVPETESDHREMCSPDASNGL